MTKVRTEGQVLRYYVGSINEERYKFKIDAVGANDPLLNVMDRENTLVFSTRYYQPLLLVLPGYGAGNNVTAAGIFADLLCTLSWKLGV